MYLFDTSPYPPRWLCGTWEPMEGWAYIAFNLLISTAYFVIPFFIMRYVTNVKEVRFRYLYWSFMFFIFSCGVTHLNEAIIFYEPIYRVNMIALGLTALASWITIVNFNKAMPLALSLRTPMQLEHEIQARTVELNEALLNLNKNNELLERRNQQLQDYAYATSHNLRSPLTSLESLVHLYKHSEGEKREEVMLRLEKVVQTFSSTVHSLGQLLEIEAQQTEHEETVEISNLVQKITTMYQEPLKSVHGNVALTHLSWHKIEAPVVVLESVLNNLLSNSIKYRDPNRDLSVEISTAFQPITKRKQLIFKDNGRGLDMNRNGDKVFGLFKTFHGNADSKGVGLYLVRKQLNDIGGDIEMQSTLGEGSTFSITF